MGAGSIVCCLKGKIAYGIRIGSNKDREWGDRLFLCNFLDPSGDPRSYEFVRMPNPDPEGEQFISKVNEAPPEEFNAVLVTEAILGNKFARTLYEFLRLVELKKLEWSKKACAEIGRQIVFDFFYKGTMDLIVSKEARGSPLEKKLEQFLSNKEYAKKIMDLVEGVVTECTEALFDPEMETTTYGIFVQDISRNISGVKDKELSDCSPSELSHYICRVLQEQEKSLGIDGLMFGTLLLQADVVLSAQIMEDVIELFPVKLFDSEKSALIKDCVGDPWRICDSRKVKAVIELHQLLAGRFQEARASKKVQEQVIRNLMNTAEKNGFPENLEEALCFSIEKQINKHLTRGQDSRGDEEPIHQGISLLEQNEFVNESKVLILCNSLKEKLGDPRTKEDKTAFRNIKNEFRRFRRKFDWGDERLQSVIATYNGGTFRDFENYLAELQSEKTEETDSTDSEGENAVVEPKKMLEEAKIPRNIDSESLDETIDIRAFLDELDSPERSVTKEDFLKVKSMLQNRKIQDSIKRGELGEEYLSKALEHILLFRFSHRGKGLKIHLNNVAGKMLQQFDGLDPQIVDRLIREGKLVRRENKRKPTLNSHIVSISDKMRKKYSFKQRSSEAN